MTTFTVKLLLVRESRKHSLLFYLNNLGYSDLSSLYIIPIIFPDFSP